jgi:hypothetical protein
MAKKRKKVKTLPTIWKVPDELWNKIKPIIQHYDPPKHMGRKRIDLRAALDAIIFRMRTGGMYCLGFGYAFASAIQDRKRG